MKVQWKPEQLWKLLDKYKYVLLALAAGVVWWSFLAPSGAWFQLYDRDSGQVVLSVPIQAGDQLQLEIEHRGAFPLAGVLHSHR